MSTACSFVPELALDAWGEKLMDRLQGRRYPFGAVFELTDRCNLSCVHCYINQPAADREIKSRELTTDQVKGILDQMADAGCLFLTFTGGEALLREDFPEIYMHARQRGFLVTLFTNGALITPRIADLLASSRPQLVEITLYGATRETYEQVTQVKGSYESCLNGIRLLKERHIPLALKTILLRSKLRELKQMRAMVAGLGLEFRYDGVLWPRLDKTGDQEDNQISMQDLIALDQQNPERLREWARIKDSFSGQLIRADLVYNCGAGLHSFHVDSTGQMSICTMSRNPAWNLLEVSFSEVWQKIGTLRETKRKLATVCQTCTIGGLCGQCPGWSQAVHGDDETPVDFVCALAHLRDKELSDRSISITEEMKV